MNNQTLPTIHREHFEQWLDSQPDERTFDYWCDRCVFGSFLMEFHGIGRFTMGSETVTLWEGLIPHRHELPDWFLPFSIRMSAEGTRKNYAITMAELREAFNLPKEQPSPFTMEPQPA